MSLLTSKPYAKPWARIELRRHDQTTFSHLQLGHRQLSPYYHFLKTEPLLRSTRNHTLITKDILLTRPAFTFSRSFFHRATLMEVIPNDNPTSADKSAGLSETSLDRTN